MMRPAIEWQERGEAYYFIADYHALTTVHDPKALREYTRGVALDFLACGLDPKKAAAWLDLGIAQSRSGHFDEAGDAFSACLAAQPDDRSCRRGLELSRSRQALQDAAAAPDTAPADDAPSSGL